MQKLSKTFCWRPFVQIYTLSDKQYAPCCHFNGSFNFQTNLDLNTDVRTAILNNQWHDGCNSCRDIEQNVDKNLSLRKMYDGPKNFETVRDNKFILKNLEISIDNSCNLACIMCNEEYSSKWVSENKKMNFNTGAKNRAFNLDTLKSFNFWNQIEELKIIGGEPLYSKNTLNLMQWLIEKNISKNIILKFTTNGTFFNEKIIKLLSNFKFCKITFSVDGIGEKFNTIRWPAKYVDVYSNFLKFKQYDNISLQVTYTYSLLNACNYITDYKELQDKFCDKISYNVVEYPRYYSAQHLPKYLKSKLIEEYSKEDFAQFYIQVLSQSDNPELFAKAIKNLKKLDSYRKTDSSILFKEIDWSAF